MKSTTLALATLLLSPLALATTCNQQSATDVSCIEDDSCGSGDSGSSTDSTDSDASLTERAVIPYLTPRAARFSARSVTRFLLSRRSAASSSSSRQLGKRQSDSIQCSGSEQCFSDADLLICLDLDSGDFSDNYGDTGNINTGAVTDSDGSATTVSDFGFGSGGSGGLGGFGGAGSTDMGGDVTTTAAAGSGLGGGAGGLTAPTQTPTRSGLNVQSGSQSTGGAVTSTAGSKTGGTASVSTGSSSGQPTGHVAGGGAGGKAGVDVAAAMGVVGLMAAMM
ncbi:MAG: hypothetical protein Q9165_008401 [Trypethelium subeluteriae]